MNSRLALSSCAAILLLSACATDPNHQRATTGAAVGAIAGAVLGHQVGDDQGRFVGAAVGALTGAAVGNYMDEQERELNRQLAQEQQNNQVELERVDEETLKLQLDSSVTFDFDSDRVKVRFYNTLDKVASSLRKYDKTAIHVVGHTDSTGSANYNQELSERRALSVGSYLENRGVLSERLLLRGEGEYSPITSNNTEFGRAKNRRVEIYLKTIVEGREQDAFQKI